MFLFFSKNEISEILVSERFKISNFCKLDIGVKSLTAHLLISNSLIFLFFFKKERSEIEA